MKKAQLIEEVVRCGKDPSYFINKYCKIRHPTRGLIPFKMFNYQEDLLDDFRFHRFNVILKSRQMGLSELAAAFVVWLILFHQNQSVLVMATKAETAKNMIKKVRTSLKHIPRWLMLTQITADNKLSIELGNGSFVKATTKSADAGRSEALSLLVVDEAAHIEGFDEIWTGLKPTVTAGGRIIMLSTPKGVGNVFHRTYADADAGLNGYKTARLMWWLHPEHIDDLRDDPDRPGFKTSTWYANETRDLSNREKDQEYNCEFLSSGDTFLMGEQLRWIETILSEPISVENFDRGLRIFKMPVKHARYLLTADVARGDARDYSAAHVFDVETMEQVAEYCGRLKPDDFAALLNELGIRYENALLVVENNAVGIACLEHLKILQYPNLYFTEKGPEMKGQNLSAAYGASDPRLIAGITTTSKNRELMLNKLEELIRTQKLLIRSKRLSTELQTFIWSNGRPEARSGTTDDLVMAAAIAAWIRDTFIQTSYSSLEARRAMLSSMTKHTVYNTDIPGASKDPRHVPRQSLGSFVRPHPLDTYRMRLSTGQELDLRQLLDRPLKIYSG